MFHQIKEHEVYVILDFGSRYTKAGFSGDGFPRFILPSVVGYKGDPATSNEEPLTAYNAIYASEKERINLIYPFEETKRVEWHWKPAMEFIMSVINQLNVNTREYNALYIEPLHSNPNNTRKVVDLLKDVFLFKKVHTYKQSQLSMHEMNTTTGLVIEMGHSLTSIVAYYKGYEMADTLHFYFFGGKTILDELQDIVQHDIVDSVSTYDLTKIVDKYFYVADDFNKEMQNYQRGKIRDRQVTLPMTGKSVNIGSERFRIPEGIFRPELLKVEVDAGLSELLREVINVCAYDTRAEILENVIISGGLSNLKGLDKRVEKEIKAMFPNLNIRIRKHDKPDATSWIGADTLCSTGVPDSFTSPGRFLNFKLPAIIHQMYNEAVACESNELWLASILLVEKALDAILDDINARLTTTKVTKNGFFLVLLDNKIITRDMYEWANELRVVKNWKTPAVLSTISKREASNTLDFLQILLDIIYNPKDVTEY
jgi:actin-related protein